MPAPCHGRSNNISRSNSATDPTLIRTYLFAYIAPGTADGKPNRTAIDAVAPAMHQQIEILDKAVAATGHLVGDQFTLADVNLLPILYYVKQLPEGAAALQERSRLQIGLARGQGRYETGSGAAW